MKTKEEILKENYKYSETSFFKDRCERYILNAMEEYAKQFNRYKIDEERMAKIFCEIYPNSIYSCRQEESDVSLCVQKYNSTLPEPLQPLPNSSDLSDEIYDLEWHTLTPNDCEKLSDYLISKYGTPKSELQPLPSEMPDFMYWHERKEKSSLQLWQHIISHYGTPPLQELPSVEKLAKEIKNIYVPIGEEKKLSNKIAQHLVNKYKLPSQPREWWMDCEKFIYANLAYKYYGYEVNHHGDITLWGKPPWKFPLSQCTPYVEPMTADDVIKAHNLSEAEVKAIREGIK